MLSVCLMQGTWVWVADHDLDGDGTTQLNIYSGRGILSESWGPVWMIGTGKFVIQVEDSLKLTFRQACMSFSFCVRVCELISELSSGAPHPLSV